MLQFVVPSNMMSGVAKIMERIESLQSTISSGAITSPLFKA